MLASFRLIVWPGLPNWAVCRFSSSRIETLATGVRIAELLLTAPERSDKTLRLLEFRSDKTLLTEASVSALRIELASSMSESMPSPAIASASTTSCAAFRFLAARAAAALASSDAGSRAAAAWASARSRRASCSRRFAASFSTASSVAFCAAFWMIQDALATGVLHAL